MTMYINILKPEELQMTLQQLDAAAQDVINAGQAREEAYGNKADLVKQRTTLKTDVDLTESEAIMNIKGEGKSAYAEMPGGEKVYLTNETAREAYRKMASQEQRKSLALVEADINALEVIYYQASDKWQTVKAASDAIQAKANLQAAMLTFMAKQG
ncbi:hypothetical protein [Brevibacillus fulvus]|uniref:Phage shock protein A n=1 Tax=Brevibacillus fulvus TaxID=1125967 RepID=A0A939BVY4_9BACL|nr:hypothetical protein [Brevibacillus fulvus]MBM7591211.1 phage shock protein A [Brevibacillus fulvus]